MPVIGFEEFVVNAKDSSIVAIGEKTHKVLSCQHVTKGDDVVSQRHERIGQNL
jgi:hypothetical protein